MDGQALLVINLEIELCKCTRTRTTYTGLRTKQLRPATAIVVRTCISIRAHARNQLMHTVYIHVYVCWSRSATPNKE